ncbi:MAG TPA: diguanylate cyclase [Pyrinomonadaceae bacterium]|jgi:diguanylate cyclase (GGDEF)-like protein/putative nucleotidyltransferase with HDIG domain
MPQGNWKSLTLLGSITVLAALLLVDALVSLSDLSLLSWTGLAPLAVLFLLTIASGRFTVSVTNADGLTQSQKSVADAFVFLAVMMYAVAPANTVAPAIVLAALVGFISSCRLSDRRIIVFTIGATIISTYVAASLYGLLVRLLVGGAEASAGGEPLLPLGMLLVPLCVLALVQYFTSMLATAAFVVFDSGKMRLQLSRESLIWTSLTQIAAAASAALFYSSLHGSGIPFVFVGILIIALVYLLYRFNEQRFDEIRRAEEEKRRHIEEMAVLHMNTIESLAIAIDAKDQTTHGHVRRTQIYATEMGKLLKVSEEETQALLAGALLHDIGKLAVPEYILNKPGKLTESEFAKMKIHTTVGGDILKRVNFPYPVEDIVRFHHEKWDGTGYPKGLKGEQIPLVARIISVVDFYDATRCDRPYRKGMKREDSLALLKKMASTSFDPKVVEVFVKHVVGFDDLIAEQDIQEQVASEDAADKTNARPDAGLASDILGTPDDTSGFRSITEAQREVFALHEIAQTIGSSLNLTDTVTLVASKLRAIVPFDTCIIYLVDDKTGKAHAAHVAGEYTDTFSRRRVSIGDGITGWSIANARSMCNTSPELDLVGIPENIAETIKGVLVSPLIRENGSFGAITLYSKDRVSYTTEHVRLLESVAQHASSALNNAMTFERTKESALTDPLTDLPNSRAFYMILEQRIAECQRLSREPMTVLSMDVDDFKAVNDMYGHAIGDRLLASVAAVIKNQLRQMDILARYAGDEFVAIMPMASGQMAKMIAERIRTAVETHKFTVRTGRTVEVGISIGIACFPEDGETSEQILTKADRNMHQDKHTRKLAPALAANPTIASIDVLR